jgi:integrase
VAELPKNMMRRKGRPGYWYQKRRGKKKTAKFLGTNYDDAVRRLKQLQGSKFPLIEVTVSVAVKRWLESYIRTSRNEKGRVLAKVRAEKHLVPALGHFRLSKLTTERVRAYRVQLEESGLAVQTVSHLLSEARCFLRWCEDAGLVDRSPFPRRLLPKIQERPPDRLTNDEAEALCGLPAPYGFVCRLALGTGLRWGELVRAQSTDVERGFLLVSQTKSSKMRRVPLDPELLAEIRTHVGKLVPFGEKSPGSFNRVVRDVSKIAGFHAHQMRHTFACRWLEDGGSLAALQQVLGHASIVTTQRYAKLTDEVVMEERLRMTARKADQKPTKVS